MIMPNIILKIKTQCMALVTALIVLCLSCGRHDGSRTNLAKLDHTLDESELYVAHKEQKLRELKQQLNASPTSEARYDVAMKLYRCYQDYQLDSSLVYIKYATAIADSLGNEERIIDTKLSLAFLYNYAGMRYEALDLFSQQNVDGRSSWLRRSYFYLGKSVYDNLASYTTDSRLREEYLSAMRLWRDSAMVYCPEDLIMQAERLSDQGDHEQALHLLLRDLPDEQTTKEAGLKYFIVAELYEKLGDRESQKKYLAMSQTVGVINAVREYVALRKLAVLVHEDGDTERAYRYIHQCIDDAIECNAKMRLTEATAILSEIDAQVVASDKRTHKLLSTALAIIVVLTISLLFIMNCLRKKMRSEQRTRREQERLNAELAVANANQAEANTNLQKSNVELRTLNERYEEANAVKKEYITRFMNLCLTYICKMEDYRKTLNKVAGKRNFDELYEIIKSSRYINAEIRDFYDNFDEAFLRIYPDFISGFNRLLRSDAQISLKQGEKMNTELRLYALLKLGISENDKLQEFLRCSSSTVYNYRTNMRNRAINRDTFERDVLSL